MGQGNRLPRELAGGLAQMREELGMGRENAGMVQRVMDLPEREV